MMNAFLYERTIDRGTHQEQLDNLTEEITFAELEERDARPHELDIEFTVAFAQFVVLNASKLCEESGEPRPEAEVTKADLSKGVRFEDGCFITVTSMILFNLAEIFDQKKVW